MKSYKQKTGSEPEDKRHEKVRSARKTKLSRRYFTFSRMDFPRKCVCARAEGALVYIYNKFIQDPTGKGGHVSEGGGGIEKKIK